MDDAGLRPDAIEKAHREGALSAVYLQPLLHNPLGISLSPGRRQDIIKVARKLDLMLIEDAVYRFLCDDPPLTALAPDRCILIDSLSKRIAPGLATGFICAPVGLRERLMTSVRSGGWVRMWPADRTALSWIQLRFNGSYRKVQKELFFDRAVVPNHLTRSSTLVTYILRKSGAIPQTAALCAPKRFWSKGSLLLAALNHDSSRAP